MDFSKQILNTKYQIPKPNTREIGELPLVKLPQTALKNPHHTKAKQRSCTTNLKKLQCFYKSKEATMLLKNSLLEIKTKEPPNKYLMYLLLKPKSHMTSSSTQSKQYPIKYAVPCSKPNKGIVKQIFDVFATRTKVTQD